MTTKTTATTTVAIAYTTATTGGRAVGFDVPGRGFDVPGRGGTAQTTRRHMVIGNRALHELVSFVVFVVCP